MGKKGKKVQAGKPKKLTPKDVGKRLNALVKKLGEELEGADLFAPLPPTEDCAICLVPLSPIQSETMYQSCCGNKICKACCKEKEISINKQNEDNSGKKVALTCPFCRKPETTCFAEEYAEIVARCLKSDHNALSMMGNFYRLGQYDETPQNDLKALDCWIQAVQLGSPGACVLIANGYNEGNGVAVDKGRAAFFKRIGALRGNMIARNNIGYTEYFDLGNHEIGIRHWKIAAEAGDQNSLNQLRKIYNANGKMTGHWPGKEFISKEEMDTISRSCYEARTEVKSEEREKHRSEE